jgi:hypothetical protein
MDFNLDTPRTAAIIAGRSVNVIAPFAEGQPLTPATAAMLNQTLKENFSNNCRDKINLGQLDETGKPKGKAASGKPGSDDYVDAEYPLTDEQVQALVDAHMADYQPGVRSSNGAPRVTDPVEREARKIARSKVVAKLKEQNLKAADVDMDELVEGIFQKHKDQFMASGKKVVAAIMAAAAATDGLNISVVAPTPAPEPETVPEPAAA